MKHYYYYCISGPGHQSSEDGFISIAENMELHEETIENLILKKLSYIDHDSILKCRELKKLPQNIINERKQELKEIITDYNDEYDELCEEIGLKTISERGEDEEIIKLLKRKEVPILIQNCHEKNIIITKEDIEKWRYRGYGPSKKYRRKIINILKKME